MFDIENSDEEWAEVKHTLPVITDSEYWKYIPDEEKDTVEKFFKYEFTSSNAYLNENTYLAVTGEDLSALMFDGFVSGKTIEWFTEDNGTTLQFSPKLEAVYFSPYLWTYVRSSASRPKQAALDQKLRQVNIKNHNLMFFPMNSTKTSAKTDTKGYHWTLLVFDMKSFQFTHYNSMCGRGKYDKYYEDAKELKLAIVEAFKSQYKLTSDEYKKLQNKIIVGTCPHQSDKPNCGVFVMKYMEDIVMQKSFENAIDYQEQVDRMKARICSGVFKHTKYSWKYEASLED